MTATFNPTAPLPEGWLALEASAGTGKTWNIAALTTRYVAEDVAPLDQLLLVTFTRAATAELRDRVRRRLVTTRTHLAQVHAGEPPPEDDPVADHLAATNPTERAARIGRLDAALRNFDAATITTIHGFCQRVLAAAGFVGELDGQAELVEDIEPTVQAAVHDLLVAQWLDRQVDDNDDRPKPVTAVDTARAVLSRPHATIRPSEDDVDPAKGVALAALARASAQRVAAQTEAAGIITFDDLLLRLDAALSHPVAGPAIEAAMRRTFAIGMVDEFQDTDPVQWAILSRLFADRRLVVIGDPKQAIYRFRGADVAAYLDATQADGTTQATLGTNHRSDPRLVHAVNKLFEGTSFGDTRIGFDAVTPRHKTVRLRFTDGERPPMQLRVMPDGAAADPARQMVGDDLAAELTKLLAEPPTLVEDDGTERPLRAGDCAVLVRTNVEADQIKTALVDAGVHAVVNGVGSVLESDAEQDWRLLLDALDHPSSPGRVRALALSPVMGRTATELAELDEPGDAELHELVHEWARVLAEHGVATLARTVAADTDLYARLLAHYGGDRWLADFTHLAELLHTASAGEATSPAGLRTWLTVQARNVEELPSDQRARRLESDADAVQILTIHRSKGLEFPVVLCPYVSSAGMAPKVPLIHTEGPGNTVIDLGSADQGGASAAVTLADRGEQLRLLYVAMTRAKHRLIVWWWPMFWGKAYRNVAMSKVLFCDGEGQARVSADVQAPVLAGGDAVRQALPKVGSRLGEDVDIVEMPATPTRVEVPPAADQQPELESRTFTGRIDKTWTRSSYSALTKPKAATPVPRTPDEVPEVADEETVPSPDTEADPDAGHLPLPLGDQPAGTSFGLLVHSILEHIDFTDDPLEVAMAVETHGQVRSTGASLPDPDGLAHGLIVACQTPLGPLFDDITLAGVPRADRLDELSFELPLAHGDSWVTLSAIASVLEEHIPDDDPFAGYAATLRDRSLARHVRGYLTGSIDLVLRRQTADGPVFHVIDHKTNRLYDRDVEGTTWHYRHGAMVTAMSHSHYLLQALLYQAALHRFLRWRQPGYDPARHLGAVGYAFVRGMAGPSAPLDGSVRCGMMAWQPPPGLTEALSDLLEEGR